MFGTWGKLARVGWLTAVAVTNVVAGSVAQPEFRFDRDTFAFANQTVFEYHEGHASLRRPSTVKRDAYNRHCFVLCRTAMQFNKFARFDPRGAPLEDTSLAVRVCSVTNREACAVPLADFTRIVFHAYIYLRSFINAV